MSLNNPQYLAVHEHDAEVTPAKLVQNFVVVKLPDKLDVLFSFIKSHLQSKIMVFFSTCAQVRFVYECFRGMQPGIPLTALHGKLKQERRTIIYMDFTRRKSACMFATDIAARGLDFPDVDWVIQVDAPEDAAMYIHRVGRTARFTASGRALLMVLPAEEKVVIPVLATAGVPIKKLTVNPKYTVSVSSHAAALLVAQPECKQLAKKAFVGYLRSLQLLPYRELQDISQLPVDEFATSLGLGFTPPLPATVTSASAGDEGRADLRDGKNVNWSLDKLKKQIKAAKDEKKRLRAEALAAANPPGIPRLVSDTGMKSAAKGEEDDLFTVKAVHAGDADDVDDYVDENPFTAAVTKKTSKSTKIKIRGDSSIRVMRDAGAKKLAFTEDGEVAPQLQLIRREGSSAQSVSKMTTEQVERAELHAQAVKARLDSARAEDHERDRQRVKGKHKESKQRVKASRNQDGDGDDGDEVGVVLGSADDDQDYGNDYGDEGSDDEDESYSKSYGGKRGGDGAGAGDSDDENSEAGGEEGQRTKKAGSKKVKGKGKQKLRQAKRRKIDHVDDENIDDVAYQEQLALKMLE